MRRYEVFTYGSSGDYYFEPCVAGDIVKAADVAPLVALVERLLPLFEERAAAWSRNPDLTPGGGPDEVTLTARFSVADLRAALEVMRG